MSVDDGAPLRELQERLGIQFRRPELLEQALVHRSLLRDQPDAAHLSNERLEFLGDAVIGQVVALYLYNQLPLASEGELTLLRTWLVRASTLGAWGGELELHQYLRLGRGDEAGARRTRLLARTFEAVVGAIYADQGLRSVERFLRPYIKRELKQHLEGRPRLDPKSRLQQVTQSRFELVPTYSVESVTGPGHDPTFTVVVIIGEHFRGTAQGGTKQQAEQAAASLALEAIEQRPVDAEPLAVASEQDLDAPEQGS